MSQWQTIRTFHLDQPFTFKDKLIPAHAIYCLKQTPKGSQYWQAFWREQGKMKSIHIGKELPFPEPAPVPSIEELMLSVSKLQEENQRLRQRIRQLESKLTLPDLPPLHLKTYQGMDNVLRAEAAILTLTYASKIMQVHYYPDHTYTIHYRPGTRLWKTIEREDALKVFSKWNNNEIRISFEKSKTPERVVTSHTEATVTTQECFCVLSN